MASSSKLNILLIFCELVGESIVLVMGLSPHVNKISNKWKDTLGMKPRILTLPEYLGPDHIAVRNL